MDPSKIAAVINYPPPSSVKSLQRFLGLVNFSLRFMPKLAAITYPLRHLLRKQVRYQWTEACQRSFQRVKELIQSSTVLAHPDFNKPFRIQTDASNHGLGAALLQLDDNLQLRPVAFISRALSSSEANYSTTEKEFLAIVWAFQRFHPYVHGSPVVVETDHKPLLGLLLKAHPPGRLLRWSLALQEYTFTLEFRKGTENTLADSLSRPEQQAAQYTPPTLVVPLTTEQLTAAQHQDPTTQELAHQIRQLSNLQATRKFMLINNVVHYLSRGQEPRIYVPQALQTAYLELHHDHPMAGHLGFHKVLHKLRTQYYWPKMRQSVSNHLRSCQIFQSIKPPPQQSGLLASISVSEPFELVGWDLTGPFPTTPNGNNYIIVIMEYMTRWCEAFAIPDGSANTVANVLLKQVILRHGCPKQLLSDQGKQFKGEVLRIIAAQLGIQQLFTSPYHPQCNGLTERMNRTLKHMLRAFIDPLHENWDNMLPFAVHAYNTSVQASTRVSPFRALFGRDPRLPLAPQISSPDDAPTHKDAADWWLYLQSLRPAMRYAITKNLQVAQQRQQRHYDKGREEVTYQPDDLV